MIPVPNTGIIAGPRLTGGVPYLRATITIAAGEVSSDVSAFPVRVNLADLPAGFWAAVASDGSDIQMFDEAEDQIPRDLVHFDYANEMGDLFFKADLLTASDNVFYVAAGSGAAAPGDASTYGRDAVWTSYYRAMVFSGGSGADRTGSGNTLSLAGNADYHQVTSALDAPFYLSRLQYVFRTRDTALSAQRGTITVAYQASWVIGAIAGYSGLLNNQYIGFYGDADGVPGGNMEGFATYSDHTFRMDNPTDGTHSVAAPTNNWLDERHFYAESRNGTTNRKFWYDGALQTTDTTTVQYPPSSGATVLTISGTNGDCLKGYYDVFYMRDSDPAADWMAAEYASWFVPGNFYTVT